MADYFDLSAALAKQVTRWEHATFVRDHIEPAYCERNGWNPGRVLKKPTADAFSYGFAADGKLLIAREGQHEMLYRWSATEIERRTYDRSAIVWAKRQRSSAKQLASAAKLVSRGRFVLAKGRIVRLEDRKRIERYTYDRAGRVVRVTVSNPKQVDTITYDASGTITRVTQTFPNGKVSERFRRPEAADRLPLLLPKIKKALLAEIPRVLARAKLKVPAYCLAITTCLEEAPHLLPPRLAVGLVSDRDARLAKGGEYVRDDLWLPDSMPLQDDVRFALRTPTLVALCKRANVAREDDAPVLAMLRQLAAALTKRGLRRELVCDPSFLIYAIDIGGEDAEDAARRAARGLATKRLTRLGML